MTVRIHLLAVFLLGASSLAFAQGQHTLPAELAAPGTPTLVPKTGGAAFGEGVVADWQGNIYSNEMNVTPRRTMQLKVGADTSKPWRTVADNPNGMWLDSKNRIIICQTRAVVRIKAGATFDNQTDTLFAYPSGGQDINDVTGDSKDNLFFSNFDGKSVYFRAAESGKARIVLSNQPQPNGLEWDEERSLLYVNEYGAGKVAVYTVGADYSLSPRREFATVRVADGMTLDEQGNVYSVANGIGVNVFNPQAKKLGDIPLAGSQATNLAFGGADFKTLFIITNKGLYKLPMKVRGYKSGSPSRVFKSAKLLPASDGRRIGWIYRNGILAVPTENPAAAIVDFSGRSLPPGLMVR